MNGPSDDDIEPGKSESAHGHGRKASIRPPARPFQAEYLHRPQPRRADGGELRQIQGIQDRNEWQRRRISGDGAGPREPQSKPQHHPAGSAQIGEFQGSNRPRQGTQRFADQNHAGKNGHPVHGPGPGAGIANTVHDPVRFPQNQAGQHRHAQRMGPLAPSRAPLPFHQFQRGKMSAQGHAPTQPAQMTKGMPGLVQALLQKHESENGQAALDQMSARLPSGPAMQPSPDEGARARDRQHGPGREFEQMIGQPRSPDPVPPRSAPGRAERGHEAFAARQRRPEMVRGQAAGQAAHGHQKPRKERSGEQGFRRRGVERVQAGQAGRELKD